MWIKDFKSCDVSGAHSEHAKPPDIRHVPNALSFWNIFSPNSRNKFSVFVFKLKEWFEGSQYTWKCTFKVLVEGRSFDKGAFRPYYFSSIDTDYAVETLVCVRYPPMPPRQQKGYLVESSFWLVGLDVRSIFGLQIFPKFVTLDRPWQFFHV